jgi:hypothetical protein
MISFLKLGHGIGAVCLGVTFQIMNVFSRL